MEMKRLKRSYHLPVEVSNYAKLAWAISWVIYLHVAYARQLFFEAFLLSIALMVACGYFLTGKGKKGGDKGMVSPDHRQSNSKGNLNMFFVVDLKPGLFTIFVNNDA